MKANVDPTITSTVKTPHVPFYVPVFNPFIYSLLRVSVPMGPMTLVTIRDRKTGKAHTNPVTPFEYNGRRYLLSPYGEMNWVRNLRAAREATIRRGCVRRRLLPLS